MVEELPPLPRSYLVALALLGLVVLGGLEGTGYAAIPGEIMGALLAIVAGGNSVYLRDRAAEKE